MLHRLQDHISNCYARAADARQRADHTADPDRKDGLLHLEENWRRLAQSYEVSEEIERSLFERSEEMFKSMEWQRVAVAPFDRVLELAVAGAGGIDTIDFPCRRVLKGWIAAASGEPVDVQPTHWRAWSSNAMPRMIKAPARQRSAARSVAQVSLLPRR